VLGLGFPVTCLPAPDEVIELTLQPGTWFAAVHECAIGTSRQFAATQHFGRFRSEADID